MSGAESDPHAARLLCATLNGFRRQVGLHMQQPKLWSSYAVRIPRFYLGNFSIL